ncbi:DUF5131 family protein [Kosmotoga pacifica]|uniref:Phage protein Gp37/Gp68 n=1 Tax=Kosmotoga pacifica TaxID=1330330 RepID=A0A0G2ZAE9_9BACT|nr:phage Gp37/Gp68 family protein [Kosmotoga pacifica]AKI96554.1 phage protein Gp37/Gp68 [Kosmotoga pacifica]
MSSSTKIEWTEATWNPVTGCSKFSKGCVHCYAERLCKRLQAMGSKKYRNGFQPTIHPETLTEPFKWKTPKMVFVVSMGDLFHESIPDYFIQQVFTVMNQAYWHTFQVLTKRAERFLEISRRVKWTSNIWAGVTVESEEYKHRIDLLREVPARVRFVSAEPLVGDLGELDLQQIHWVIAGGESGPASRKLEADWVRSIRDQCLEQNVLFFFKQWGGFNKKKNGRVLDGRTWDEKPNKTMTVFMQST